MPRKRNPLYEILHNRYGRSESKIYAGIRRFNLTLDNIESRYPFLDKYYAETQKQVEACSKPLAVMGKKRFAPGV